MELVGTSNSSIGVNGTSSQQEPAVQGVGNNVGVQGNATNVGVEGRGSNVGVGRDADTLSDQPLLDTTEYGSGPDDSISDATENAAVTQHRITISGATISYTARAGHLVTYDQYSARPSAKIFYVSFTANGVAASSRPVTFFYNGGPGSSSVFLLLGTTTHQDEHAWFYPSRALRAGRQCPQSARPH